MNKKKTETLFLLMTISFLLPFIDVSRPWTVTGVDDGARCSSSQSSLTTSLMDSLVCSEAVLSAEAV